MCIRYICNNNVLFICIPLTLIKHTVYREKLVSKKFDELLEELEKLKFGESIKGICIHKRVLDI